MAVKEPRLRLPIKNPKIGPIYFATHHDATKAKTPIDPSRFQLVRLVSTSSGGIKFRQLYCAACNCPGCDKLTTVNMNDFDYYATTKAEVARIKVQVLEYLQDLTDKAIDEF